MKHKSWFKRQFKINIWLVIIITIFSIFFFLSLPAIKIANTIIPDNITKNYLPDLLPGNGFTASKKYVLQPQPDSNTNSSLSEYAKILQQRLGSTQLSFDSYKVILNNNEIIVEIPQTLDIPNTNALLTNPGNLKLIISKSQINDVPKEEQLFHFITAQNYDSTDINRQDIKKIHIRRNSVNLNSQSLKKAPLIFIISFTKEGEEKIKKLHITENFNKLLAIQLDDQVLTSGIISIDSANAFEQNATLNVRYLFGLENSPHIVSLMRNNALPTSLVITSTSLVNPLFSFKTSFFLSIFFVIILLFSLNILTWYKKLSLKALIIWSIGIGSYLTTMIVFTKLFHLTFGISLLATLLTSTTLLVTLFVSLIYDLSLSKRSFRFTMWHHHTKLFTKIIIFFLLFPGILLLIAPNPFHYLGNIFLLSFFCLSLSIIVTKILFQQLINNHHD